MSTYVFLFQLHMWPPFIIHNHLKYSKFHASIISEPGFKKQITHKKPSSRFRNQLMHRHTNRLKTSHTQPSKASTGMRQKLHPHSRKYHINDNKRKTDDARTNTYSLAPPVVKKQTQSQGHRPKVHEIIPNPFPGHHKLQMRPWFLQNVKTAHNRQSSSSQSSVQQGTHFLLFRWPTYS